MATILVSNLQGQAWVKDSNGNIKTLQNGMVISESDNVITGAGASLDLTSNSFNTISISENRSVRLDNNVNQTSPNAIDNAAQPLSDEAQEILTALDVGDDIFENLEPTAAVIQGGGDAAGGSSFTRLLSIVETTNPLAIEYPKMGITNPEDRITGLPTGDDAIPATTSIAPLANTLFPIISINDVLVSEGDFASFKVEIENPAPVDTTITFTINPGTAGFDDLWADGEDRYVIVNGQEIPVNEDGKFDVNVPAGTTEINVVIPTYNDNVFEGEENFTITGELKGNVDGNDFTSEDTGTGTIVDDGRELPPEYNGNDPREEDPINPGDDTENPGEDNNDTDNPNEPLTADDDRPRLEINGESVYENNNLVFNITISNPIAAGGTSSINLNFDFDGADDGKDNASIADLWDADTTPQAVIQFVDTNGNSVGNPVTVNVDTTNGSLDTINVPAGAQGLTVTVPTLLDGVKENTESFTLNGTINGEVNGIIFNSNDYAGTATGIGVILDADITATPDRNFVKEAGVGEIDNDPNSPNQGKSVATGNVITGLVDGNINPDFTDNEGEDLDNLYLTEVTYNDETKGFGPDNTVTFDTDYGQLVINQDGSYEFTLDNDKPAVDELRPDSDLIDLEFDYTLSNGIATTDSTLTITIEGTNDRPEITSNEYGLNEETLIINGKLTATDTDAEEDELTWSIIGEENDNGSFKGNYGNITIDEKTGEWTYTRDENITVGSHAGKDKLVGSESDNKWIKESFDVKVTDKFGANDNQKINLVQAFLYENRTNSGFLRLNGNQKLAFDLFGKENLTSDKVIILSNTSSQSLFVRKGSGNSVTEIKPGEDFVIQINQDGSGNPILDFNDIRTDAYWSGRVDGGFKLTLAEDNRSEDAKAQGSGTVENLDGLTTLDQALVDLHVYTSPLLNSADRGPEDAGYDRYGSIWSMSSTKNYGEDRDFHLFKSGGNHMFYGGDLDGSLVAKAVTLHIAEGWTISDGTNSWTLGSDGEVPEEAGFTVSFDNESGLWLVHMKPNAEYSSTNQSQFPDTESLEYVDVFANDIRNDWTITPPAGSKEATEIKYEIDYAEWAYTYQIGSGNPEWGWLEANKVHTKTLEADPKSTKFDNSNVTVTGDGDNQTELKVFNNKVIAGNDGDKLTMTTGHNYNAANTAENGWIKLNVEGENGFDLSDRWQSMDSDETLYALLTPFKLENSSSTNTTNMSAKYAGEAAFRYIGDDGEYVYVSFNDASATARRGFLVPKDKLDSIEFRGPDGHYGIFHIKVSAYVVDTNTWENGTVKTNIEVSGQSYLTNIKVAPRNDIQNLKINAEVDNDFIALDLDNPNNLNTISNDINIVNLRIAADTIEGLIYDGQEIQADDGYYYVNNFDATKELKVSVAETINGNFVIEANTSGEYRTTIDNNGEPQDHSKSDTQPQRLELGKDTYETDWQEYGKVEFESPEGSVVITDVTNIVYAGAQGGEVSGTTGNDVMHGGAGDDVFKFTASDISEDNPATDTIKYFGTEGHDLLDISQMLGLDSSGDNLDNLLYNIDLSGDGDNNLVIKVTDKSDNTDVKQTIVLDGVDYDDAIAKGAVQSLNTDGKFHSDM